MKPFVLIAALAWAGSAAMAAAPVLQQASPAHVAATTSLANAPATLHLEVDTPDGPLGLNLRPATRMQSQAARVVAAVREGRTRLYKGRVAGRPASWVRMARIDGAWLGAIAVDGKLWLLDPARQHPQLARSLGLSDKDSLVFTLDDFRGLDVIDDGGVLPPATTSRSLAYGISDAPRNRTASSYHLGVTLVLDTEFQAHYGANAQSTAVGILNIVDGFYTAQADTQVYLYDLVSLASDGSLTSTDPQALLNAFASYSQASLPFSGLAHLLSGKDFDGSTIGLAWTGVADPGYADTVCNSYYGTGVDQQTFSAAASAATLAHEMGHNYGAAHDGDGNSCPVSGYIMNATTNTGNPPTQFSGCSLDYFVAYRSVHSTPCLAAPPDVIFNNGFE